MFKSITFHNFKALRDVTIPLGRLNLLFGPNGSGKSTILQALRVLSGVTDFPYRSLVNFEATNGKAANVSIKAERDVPLAGCHVEVEWQANGQRRFEAAIGPAVTDSIRLEAQQDLGRIQVFSFVPKLIEEPVEIKPSIKLDEEGRNLAGVLHQLRYENDEAWIALNHEMHLWLPEFDLIDFPTVESGKITFALRTVRGKYKVPAKQLSHGTLLAIALLTLVYRPNPPTLICLEEPDRGLHPRLMRNVRDALVRLSHPEGHGEARPPVQVIVTSHSPYLLDLFRDHPEEILMVEKEGLSTRITPLSDLPHFEEILGDASLSDLWYSGVLGGVPAAS